MTDPLAFSIRWFAFALDNLFVWFFAWPHWLEYLIVGWVFYGAVMLPRRKATPKNFQSVLVVTLTLWPLALLLQLLEWAHHFALWCFMSEGGPVQAVGVTLGRIFTRWHRSSGQQTGA